MKNNFNKNTMLAGSVLLAFAIFAIAFGAFPHSANAQYYGGTNCPYPTVWANGYYKCSYQPTTVITPAPVYSYNNYTYQQQTYQQPQYPTLSASCYVNNTSVPSGSSVQWTVNANGGNGSYSYLWSGTDGLSGSGQSIYMTYYNTGAKTASVTIYSGGQSQSVSCGNSVTVYNSNTYQPTYNYYSSSAYQYYSPITASCVANTTSAPIGSAVVWSATATGGNGYYSYSWSGTDGIYGQGQAISYTYSQPSTKYASVTIYSNGQTVTEPCSNYVTIGTVGISGFPFMGVGSNNNGLDIGCYSDPTTAGINQPITWSAEVTGGAAPYTYSWTGSDGLTGSQASTIKYYATRGDKSAIVSVTSADGKTATHACSTSLTVRGATTGTVQAQPQPQVQQPQPQVQNNQGLSASALFSLNNIPWGWVAVLIILILFAAVMYLLFNKPKI